MAVLTEENRLKIYAKFMVDESRNEHDIDVSKSILKSAVDAVDTWINNNAASYNAALPELARNNLTGKQKYMLFKFVADKRWEVG